MLSITVKVLDLSKSWSTIKLRVRKKRFGGMRRNLSFQLAHFRLQLKSEFGLG